MKENCKDTTFDSRCLGQKNDTLAFGSKERYALNNSRMDAQKIEMTVRTLTLLFIIRWNDNFSLEG